MSLSITSLNSGSNGNACYIGNDNEAVLVDAGISCREIEKRMKRLGLCMSKVKAVFISHEHSDHIRGIPLLARKYKLPVFVSALTLRHCPFLLDPALAVAFRPYEEIVVGSLVITPFPKFHDASDPFSFLIEGNQVRVGVFTDIGKPCEHVIHHFRQCHAAFLEANYDEKMLLDGRYPVHLKNRIRGGFGHLSNTQALDLFLKHRPPFMSHLLLSHLSQENNHPDLVYSLFKEVATSTEIVVASRHKETSVYRIESLMRVEEASLQLELFQ